MLPRLRRERPPHLSWESATFTPGKVPFYNLAAALLTIDTAQQDKWNWLGKAEKLGRDLANGVIRLEAALVTALADTPGANRLLLIVDQAEELFTLIKEQEELFTPTIEQDEMISPTTQSCEICPLRRSVQSQAKNLVFPLDESLSSFAVNHTFLYLHPRDK